MQCVVVVEGGIIFANTFVANNRMTSQTLNHHSTVKWKRFTRSVEKQSLRETLVQVARLYYQENLSQREIAVRLGVSRSLIAHYLRQAREAGIVRIQIVDPGAACRGLAASLKKMTGLKHVVVLPNLRGSTALTIRSVASAAAHFLTEKLKDGDTFGLAWGRTTGAVVDMLSPPRARRIDVVPLMGESGRSGMHTQMNQLVMQAAQRLGAKPHFLSLPMVLSSNRLRNALAKESSIRDVLARWNSINIACVGIGVVPPVPGMIVYIGEEHLPRLIEAGAVGDMCGIYYNREGRIIRTGLEDRMIAINLDQLRSVGCLVAVASGEEKALAVSGALRTGLLSAIFIDQAMAEDVLAELKRQNTRES